MIILRRLFLLTWFLLRFFKTFVQANLEVAKLVLLSDPDEVHSQFLTVKVDGMSRMQATLLAQCITLTPGTVSVELNLKEGKLIIHHMGPQPAEEVLASIDHELKKPIKAMFR